MKIKIVEGFEMVGKSVVLKSISHQKAYRPDYDIYDKNFENRESAFMFYFAQSDLFKHLKERGETLPSEIVYDRSTITSYVYSKLYEEHKPIGMTTALQMFKNYSLSLDVGESIEIYHVEHSSEESAERIYDSEQTKNTHTERYDKFGNFISYMNMYHKANEYFYEVYNILKEYSQIDIYLVKTFSNTKGDKVYLDVPERIE